MDATLLQLLQHKGCLPTTTVKEYLRKTMGCPIKDEAIEETRLSVNRELDFADIEIRRMTSPFDARVYLALVNKQSNDAVSEMLAKKYSSPRFEYLRRLMMVILRSTEEADGAGCISEADALQIGHGTVPGFDAEMGLKLQDCQAAVSSLLGEGWILPHPHRSGHYTLGIRSFLEFHDEVVRMDMPDERRTLLEEYL